MKRDQLADSFFGRKQEDAVINFEERPARVVAQQHEDAVEGAVCRIFFEADRSNLVWRGFMRRQIGRVEPEAEVGPRPNLKIAFGSYLISCAASVPRCLPPSQLRRCADEPDNG